MTRSRFWTEAPWTMNKLYKQWILKLMLRFREMKHEHLRRRRLPLPRDMWLHNSGLHLSSVVQRTEASPSDISAGTFQNWWTIPRGRLPYSAERLVLLPGIQFEINVLYVCSHTKQAMLIVLSAQVSWLCSERLALGSTLGLATQIVVPPLSWRYKNRVWAQSCFMEKWAHCK